MSSENQNTAGAFSQAKDLKNRILFTILLLVIYRLGTYVPISGIDPQALKEIMGNSQKGLLGLCFLAKKQGFLASPDRDLFSQHRGFQFGAILGTDIFGDTPPPNIDQNPHPYSGLSQSLPGPHASLWTDQIPDLRIYVVIAV